MYSIKLININFSLPLVSSSIDQKGRHLLWRGQVCSNWPSTSTTRRERVKLTMPPLPSVPPIQSHTSFRIRRVRIPLKTVLFRVIIILIAKSLPQSEKVTEFSLTDHYYKYSTVKDGLSFYTLNNLIRYTTQSLHNWIRYYLQWGKENCMKGLIRYIRSL